MGWHASHGTRHETTSLIQAAQRPCREQGTSRVGLGKIRHLDAGLLWIQHHVSRRNLQIDKAAGSENKAKDVNAETITTLMKAMNFKESKERHPC